jgi:lipopolysaccharide/colanic/teichoic acid biosynthesis glycosyltransferase
LKYANEEELLASVNDPQGFTDKIIWPDKVRINLDYFHNRTFLGDMLLILKTIFPFELLNKHSKTCRTE